MFAADDLPGFVLHVEICEDFWAPTPPSTYGALAGATILANLSASNIIIGKADDRHLLCRSQSARAVAAYVYSAAGPGESTTDLAWDGQGVVYEIGDLLAETERFPTEPELAHRRRRPRAHRSRSGCACTTFNDAADHAARRSRPFRRVALRPPPALRRRRPDPRRSTASRSSRTAAASSTRTATRPTTSRSRASPRRFERPSGSHMVIGVSGGLDSTHALIVAAKVCDRLRLPRTTILGFTMPGFATSDGTKSNAWTLMNALGVTGRGDRHPPGRPADARRHRPPLRRAASRSTTSPSRTCRPGCAPTTSSASPTSTTASSSAPATSPSWRSAGAPTASATR